MSVAIAPSPAADSLAVRGDRRTWMGAVLLTAVGVELVLLFAPTAAWLLQRWTMSVWHNAHGLLIPPAVAWFAWRELRVMRNVPATGSAWGFLLLIPALLLHVLDTGIHTQILSAASIVLALPGLSLLFLGVRHTRAIAFPLALSALMLPVPLAATERLHLLLRHIGTYLTAQIVPWLGITVHAEDTAIYLREGVLVIGDGCSGFSTLYAACAVAALAAYSCNHRRGRLLALLAAAPLAIAANVVRLVLLVLIVRWMGMPALDTWLHPASGVLTFVLSVPVILWLARPKPGSAS